MNSIDAYTSEYDPLPNTDEEYQMYTYTPSDAVQLLERAGEIIADPDNWTKGTHARDSEGEAVDYWVSDACSFCLGGAVRKAAYETNPTNYYDDRVDSAQSFAEDLLDTAVGGDYSLYNDHEETTHEDVKLAIIDAITEASEYGPWG